MPTVFRNGAYRFFFYSSNGVEPIHIHVQKDRAVAKFWCFPVHFVSSSNFSRGDLRQIERIVEENEELIRSAWNDFFGR